MRKKHLWFFISLLFLLFLSGCSGRNSRGAGAEPRDGVLDLTGWSFSKQGNVSMDGKWAFYWDQLVSPGEFDGADLTGYFSAPPNWTQYKGAELPSYGSATYRVVVKTDGETGLYGIILSDIYTEYALWINGKLFDACGSLEKAGSSPVYLQPRLYDFVSEGN